MRILQFNKQEFSETLPKMNLGESVVILESQPFGADEDIRYNCVTTDKVATLLIIRGVGRIIEDKGRTTGYWQNMGGKGVLGLHAVSTLNFSSEAIKAMKGSYEAQIRFNAPTWREIISIMPFSLEFKKVLGLATDTADSLASLNRNNFSQVNLTSQI